MYFIALFENSKVSACLFWNPKNFKEDTKVFSVGCMFNNLMSSTLYYINKKQKGSPRNRPAEHFLLIITYTLFYYYYVCVCLILFKFLCLSFYDLHLAPRVIINSVLVKWGEPENASRGKILIVEKYKHKNWNR